MMVSVEPLFDKSITTYGYDANKNLSAATSGGVMNGYSFTTQQDAEDRLTQWARNLPGGNGESQTFGLTDVGDWNTYGGDRLENGVLTAFNETRQHNNVHEILEIDDGTIKPIVHDAKGNLTLDDEGRTYVWDFENRLKEVRDSNGDLLVSCTYDALGRRTTKMVPGVAGGPSSTTAFVHLTDTSGGGMGQLLAEYEDNALKRQHTYGTYIDEPLTLTNYDASLPGGEETLWYHRDRQYNVIGLTSGGGAVVERYAYGPYGERRVLAPDGVTVRQVSAYGNPLGHQGLYHDDETGLIKNGARYRDPRVGRFLSRDPSGYVDGPHLYQLLTSRPLNLLDPTGNRVVAKFRYIPTGHIRGRRMSYNQYMNQMRLAGKVIQGGIVGAGIGGGGGGGKTVTIGGSLGGGNNNFKFNASSQGLISMIPIVGTVVNAAGNPKGSSRSDYGIDCGPSVQTNPQTGALEKCDDCKTLGKAAAEQKCKSCIDKKAIDFITAYAGPGVAANVGEMFGGGMVAAGASGPVGWVVGGVLVLDGLADTAISVGKIEGILDAAATVKSFQCVCP